MKNAVLLVLAALAGFSIGRFTRTPDVKPIAAPKLKTTASQTSSDLTNRSLSTTVVPPIPKSLSNEELMARAKNAEAASKAESLLRRSDAVKKQARVEYQPVFDKLGIPKDKQESLFQLQDAVFDAKLASVRNLTDWAFARAKYAQQVYLTLGSDDLYSVYEEVERNDRARREVERLASTNSLDESQKNSLIDIFRETGAYSRDVLGAYGGAYSDFPPAVAGTPWLIERHKADLARATENAHNVLSATAGRPEISEETKAALSKYLDDEIAAIQKALTRQEGLQEAWKDPAKIPLVP